MTKEFIKRASEGECRAYEVVAPVAQKYNPQFKRLELPIPIRIDGAHQQITLPFYEGQKLVNLWHESDGGSRMDLQIAPEAAEVIADLAKVDLADVIPGLRSHGLHRAEFDHSNWLGTVVPRLGELVRKEIIHPSEAKPFIDLVSQPWTSRKIFTNGDFYPRNFIPQPDGKIALVDWDPRIGDNRLFIVDHLESVVAFMFIHMWGNRRWQVHFMKHVSATFKISPEDLQRSLLFRSFEQAYYWRGERPQLLYPQISILRDALSIDHVARWL